MLAELIFNPLSKLSSLSKLVFSGCTQDSQGIDISNNW